MIFFVDPLSATIIMVGLLFSDVAGEGHKGRILRGKIFGPPKAGP